MPGSRFRDPQTGHGAALPRATLAFFALAAVAGTLTTAFNTIASQWVPRYDGLFAQAALRHDALYMAREWVLLLHAPATFLPIVGLALLLWRRSPAASILAVAATGVEKLVELLGQTVRVFVLNPLWREQLATGDAQARLRAEWLIGGFAEVWNAMFFVLWTAGSVAAVAVAVAAWHMPRLGRVFAASALLAAALGCWLTAVDYFGFPLPPPDSPGLYAAVMTAYRALVAVVLVVAFAGNPGLSRPSHHTWPTLPG